MFVAPLSSDHRGFRRYGNVLLLLKRDGLLQLKFIGVGSRGAKSIKLQIRLLPTTHLFCQL